MPRLILFAAYWLTLVGFEGFAQTLEPPAARLFGDEIRCRDLRAQEPRACAMALLRRAQSQAIGHFAEQNALSATPREVNRLVEYNRAFELHDRAQRRHKLAEIEMRLASDELAVGERERLEKFRAVLLRLAAYEDDLDAGTEVREPFDAATLRGWIESAKVNALLYSRYGGVVGVRAHGPYAHGALARLIAEYMQSGEIQLLDASVATFFQATLRAPPLLVHRQGEPDFTPFWERPIVPSYIEN